MKILPDYLINIMPEIEEAIEELRLSVMDHAYDLLKCLDIDELTTDDIRHKLEVLNLRMENLTESWLPNGRFYRIYPLIKYNRARLNDINSVVRSGGQFEGLWSNDFNKKVQFNFNAITTVRHYTAGSTADGYFYITGDVNRNYDNTISNSTLTALSSDILLSHAMPAGYTYLYVPWPRPAYPADSDYFYNVNMLQFDRLHYAIDCDDPVCDSSNINHINDNKNPDGNSSHYYPENKPASLNYEDLTLSKLPTPYWFDYHYLGGTYYISTKNSNSEELKEDDIIIETTKHTENEYQYIVEHGRYYDAEGHELYTVDGSRFATKYELDPDCSELNNSNAIFPTNCYEFTCIRHPLPSEEPEDYFYNYECYEDEYGHKDIFSPKTLATEYIHNYSFGEDFNHAHYRFDNLLSNVFALKIKANHIKTYRPFWNESAPIFANMQSRYTSSLISDNLIQDNDSNDIISTNDQSDNFSESYIENGSSNDSENQGTIYNVDLNPKNPAQNSLYYWFKHKQDNNIQAYQDGVCIKDDRVTKNNYPQISKITHTNIDRPTVCKTYVHVGFTTAASDNDDDIQYYNCTHLNNSDITVNYIYADGEKLEPITYDPSLSYTIISISYINKNTHETNTTDGINIKSYLMGDPTKTDLYINPNSNNITATYITYNTSRVHKLYFSRDKSNVTLNKNISDLFNEYGSTFLYAYSKNTVGANINIIGIYDSSGQLIDYNEAIVYLHIVNNKYYVSIKNANLTAAYVLFTIDFYPGSVERKTTETVDLDATYYISSKAALSTTLETIDTRDIE